MFFPMDESAAKRISVTGRVQGVGYRYAARARAYELGVTGWIRNAGDGAVEVFAQGPPRALDPFLAWLSGGPPGAQVEDVEATDVEEDASTVGFAILP